MATFQASLAPELISGKRMTDPMFHYPGKSMAFRIPTILNFTTSEVYKNMLRPDTDPIPRLHSAIVPRFLRLRRWQREALEPSPYRLYERWPLGRFLYRASWVITGFTFFQASYRMYYLLKDVA